MLKFLKFFLLLTIFLICLPLRAVTLDQKIGQMILIGFNGKKLDDKSWIKNVIIQDKVGGVILFDYDYQTKQYNRNIESPKQLKTLVKQLNHYHSQSALRAYPLLISIDYEGGKVNRLKESYGFPETQSAAKLAQIPLKEAEKSINTMALTLKQVGINLDFAPVVDVNLNKNNPVIGSLNRSFSDNVPTIVKYAQLFSNRFKVNHLLCVYKHFPGHGSSTLDTHQGLVDVTKVWKMEELQPYRLLIAAPHHCQLIMTGHLINRRLDPSGLPASLSKRMTEGLIRKQLKFTGVIVTDDLQMNAIAQHFSIADTIVLAINAGADLLLFGNQLTDHPVHPQEIITMVKQAIKRGKISEKRIDQSFQRLLKLKRTLA